MAKRYDLHIEQGSTFSLEIECQDESGGAVDLTGSSIAGQVRRSYASAAPAAVFLGVVAPGRGLAELSLTAAQTAQMQPGRAVWDCELTFPGGTVQRLLEGSVRITPEVTR